MASEEGLLPPARRVRAFLVGFRWFAVALGLILTYAHQPDALLYHRLALVPYATVFIVLVMEGILTGMASRVRDGGQAIPLIFIDILLGFGLSWCFSMGYFLLAAVLPVVEVAYYFGGLGALLSGMLCFVVTLGMGAWHAYNVWGDNSNAKDPQRFLNALVVGEAHQMVVAVVVTILLAWIASQIKSDEGDIRKVQLEMYQMEQQLRGKIDDGSKDARDAMNLAETRQQRLDRLDAELAESKDELEGVHRELHEKKAQVQAIQQMGQKKEQQQSQVHKREIEEHKAEIDNLHHLLDRVTVLVDITRDLHQSIHIDETLLAVLQGALKLVRSQTGILFIIDESQNPPELYPEAAAGPYQSFFTNYSFKMGEGVPGWVAARLQPIKIDNETTTIDGETLGSLVSYERSAVVVPLADGERRLGVLYLGRPDPSAFTDEEVEDLIEFCRHASRSVANAADYHRAVTQGIIDGVSGLYNQMYFSERLREEEKRSKRYRYPVTLMLLDIDNFTSYNNAYGHERGNQLLRELAEILREHTRETDVGARLQNDEFGVLLVESEKNHAIMIGERIRTALEMRYMARVGKGKSVSVSLGLAAMPKDTKDAAELYQLAEDALINAKKSGGNQSAWAS